MHEEPSRHGPPDDQQRRRPADRPGVVSDTEIPDHDTRQLERAYVATPAERAQDRPAGRRVSHMLLSQADVTEAEEEARPRAAAVRLGRTLGPRSTPSRRRSPPGSASSHAVALSSGTAALHLGLLELGAGPGDVVIVPTMTFAATANAVVYTGAEPVFVDSDRDAATSTPRCSMEAIDDRCGPRAPTSPRS